jgi:hypothetical protein
MKKHLPIFLFLVFSLGLSGLLQAQGVVQMSPEKQKAQVFDKQDLTGAEVIDAPASDNDFRYPAYAIGLTYYDLQSNGSNQNRLRYHGNGLLSAAWTMSLDEFDTAFPNRGTGYNLFDGNAWNSHPTARLENLRIGWPGVNVDANGTVAVVAHVSDPANPNALYISRKEVGGSWTQQTIPSAVNVGSLWPRSAVDENGTLHVFGLTTPIANGGAAHLGVDGHLLYYRSTDFGLSWDMTDVVIPGFDNTNYTAMGADAYAIDANAGTVAFAHFDDWNDITLYKSTDGGDNWDRLIVNDFPLENYVLDTEYSIADIGGVDTLGPGGFPGADSTALKAIYTSDNAGSVVVDNNGKSHVFFGEMYVSDGTIGDGTSSFYPGWNGIAYWNEDMLGERPVTITGSLDNNGDGTLNIDGTIATYFFSLSSMPHAVCDENNHLYLAYSAVMEDFRSIDDQHYRHIYLMKSEDEGETWTDPVDVITEDIFEDDDELFAFIESVFPTIDVDDTYLHLIYQSDFEPGLHVRGDMDAVFENEIIYLKFDKATLTLIENVVSPEALGMNVSPNPAQGQAQLTFDLLNEAKTSIEVLSLDGKVLKSENLGSLHSGAHSQNINLDGISTGMYMVKLIAGNRAATMKLIVK